MLVGNLGRSRLAGHLEGSRQRGSLAAQSLADDVLQDGLHHRDGLLLGNTLLQHHGRELADGLTVLHQLRDETRLHHLAVIGNGIIERHRVDGCNLRLIAYRHPRQRRLTPVFRAVGGLRVHIADDGLAVAYQRQLQILSDAYAAQPGDILLGMAAVELVDDIARADVGADLQRAGHINVLIAATTPVVVLHPAAVHLHHATAGMYHIARIAGNDAVVKGHEHRCHLEHRTRFTAVADGRVDGLGILAVRHPEHIDNSLHVARLHLHQDGHAHLGIHLWQLHLLDEGTLGQVLHTHIDGRHDVGTVHGRYLGDIHNLVEYLLTMHQSVLSAQQ